MLWLGLNGSSGWFKSHKEVKNKLDLTINKVFVQSGFKSWQEVKSSAQPLREASTALSTFSGKEEEEKGKKKNKNVRYGQIKPVL